MRLSQVWLLCVIARHITSYGRTTFQNSDFKNYIKKNKTTALTAKTFFYLNKLIIELMTIQMTSTVPGGKERKIK